MCVPSLLLLLVHCCVLETFLSATLLAILEQPSLLLKVCTSEACVSADACALDLAVYSSHSSNRRDIASVPVNALRNRALAMATTEVGLICQ